MKKIILIFLTLFFTTMAPAFGKDNSGFDKTVKRFLDAHQNNWQDWNIPYEDGQALYDFIIENNIQTVLEIGTSTGHSSIWMAWALSKTGGMLTTLEISSRRYNIAVKNFQKAGVSKFITPILGDAHQLVKTLDGPWDMVFSDADKDWYTQYFKILEPKLKGCFLTHNVTDGFSGADDFLNYVKKQKNYTTIMDRTSSAGISITCKQF